MSESKNHRMPIPPLSILRIDKLWPHARKQGHEKGDIWRVGYYSKQDGLDVVWLVDEEGSYEWTTDHKWLYQKFEVISFSDETDFYGSDRPPLKHYNHSHNNASNRTASTRSG